VIARKTARSRAFLLVPPWSLQQRLSENSVDSRQSPWSWPPSLRPSRIEAPSLRRCYPGTTSLSATLPTPAGPRRFRLARARHRQGFPCCIRSPARTCRRHYPGGGDRCFVGSPSALALPVAGSLPREPGGSASVLRVSRPARRSWRLRQQLPVGPTDAGVPCHCKSARRQVLSPSARALCNNPEARPIHGAPQDQSPLRSHLARRVERSAHSSRGRHLVPRHCGTGSHRTLNELPQCSQARHPAEPLLEIDSSCRGTVLYCLL